MVDFAAGREKTEHDRKAARADDLRDKFRQARERSILEGAKTRAERRRFWRNKKSDN